MPSRAIDHERRDNLMLRRLSRDDLRLIEPHLAPVELPLRDPLELPNERIEQVVFIDSGFASTVASGSVEVGLIGREGVTGLAVIMGTDRTPHETYMQSAGAGRKIRTAKLKQAMRQSETLRRALLNYGHTFVTQLIYTARANALNTIEQRLARWLLMALDRADADRVTLTHEFIALMLGVHRPGVTVALNLLEGAGLIQARPGVIAIIDRKGLEKKSGGAYGVPEAEYRRLFGRERR